MSPWSLGGKVVAGFARIGRKCRRRQRCCRKQYGQPRGSSGVRTGEKGEEAWAIKRE